MKRGIQVYYEKSSPESREQCECFERGEVKFVECDVEEAIKYLRDNGPVEPSNSPSYHSDTWYTQTGEHITRDWIERGIDYRESYVPVGFTDDGEREIYAAVTRK